MGLGGGGCKREGGWQATFNSTKRGCRKDLAMLKAEEAGRGGGHLSCSHGEGGGTQQVSIPLKKTQRQLKCICHVEYTFFKCIR